MCFIILSTDQLRFLFLPSKPLRRRSYMSSHFEDEMKAVFKFSVVSVFLVPNYRPVGLLISGEIKALRDKRISLLCTK